MSVDFNERTTDDLLFHWRKYYGLWTRIWARSNLKLKCLNYGFVSCKHSLSLHMMLTDVLEWFGLFVDYCDYFISCIDSHSDGTHSLQRIHWWASDGMLHLSKYILMKKQTHLHLGWPEVHFQQIHFSVNHSFKCPKKGSYKLYFLFILFYYYYYYHYYFISASVRIHFLSVMYSVICGMCWAN